MWTWESRVTLGGNESTGVIVLPGDGGMGMFEGAWFVVAR